MLVLIITSVKRKNLCGVDEEVSEGCTRLDRLGRKHCGMEERNVEE